MDVADQSQTSTAANMIVNYFDRLPEENAKNNPYLIIITI